MFWTARSEAPDAGIGTFAAASRTAGTRGDNRYSITLACTAPREATLVIDIHGVDRAGATAGHVGHAVKRLQLIPRRPLRVDICLRWRREAQATFEVEGVREPADESWMGVSAGAPFVSLAAALHASDGRCLDRTVIFQGVDEERMDEQTAERTGPDEPAA